MIYAKAATVMVAAFAFVVLADDMPDRFYSVYFMPVPISNMRNKMISSERDEG